jgi:hypothetical protein
MITAIITVRPAKTCIIMPDTFELDPLPMFLNYEREGGICQACKIGDKGTKGQGDKGTRGQGDKGTRGQGEKGRGEKGKRGKGKRGVWFVSGAGN